MKGMEISRRYFEEYGKNLVQGEFKEYMAAGLAGEGSECFGYDDDISSDHDFGPGFIIWLPDDIYRREGEKLQAMYDMLPRSYMGYERIKSVYGGGRVGVMSIEDFYMKFTGIRKAPEDNIEWFKIPETFLATATNGQVFIDNLGLFSEIRAKLKGFYPEDVVKKKLAAKCALMAQSGQYNYPRSLKRGDMQAAYFACCEFVKNALSAIFILNSTYMPYYKWAFKKAEELICLKEDVTILKQITQMGEGENKAHLIEEISLHIGAELNKRAMTRTGDSFLQSHGEELMRSVNDARLKGLHAELYPVQQSRRRSRRPG